MKDVNYYTLILSASDELYELNEAVIGIFDNEKEAENKMSEIRDYIDDEGLDNIAVRLESRTVKQYECLDVDVDYLKELVFYLSGK